MNCLSTLPMNLCIKRSERQGGGYEVWSLEKIRIRTSFGPYKGRFVNNSKQHQSKGFQWKVETRKNITMTLDGSEEKESNWLRYVNYAINKEEQNLVAIQCHSEIYFIACKTIPANKQLFIWYQECSDNRSNCKEEMSTEHSLAETQDMQYFSATKNPNQKQQIKEMDQCIGTTSIQPSAFPSSSFNQLKPVRYAPSQNIQHNKLDTTEAVSSTQEIKSIIKDKPYGCEVCHKRYTQKSKLRIHKRNHTGEKPFHCIICNKSFKAGSYLKTHLLTHSTERPYECDICKQNYKSVAVLKAHKVRHTRREKQFECEVCNKRFVLKCELKKHIRLHTGEKPYECDVCHKKFRLSGRLNIHRTIHTGKKAYECQICLKRFRTYTSLASHRRIHTGEKPFECKVCHKKFRFDSPFRTHMKIHTKKKSFQCEICHKMFTKRSRFKGCCKLPFKRKVCGKDDFLNHNVALCENSALEERAAELEPKKIETQT